VRELVELWLGLLVTVTLTPGVGVKVLEERGAEEIVLELLLVAVIVLVLLIVLVLVMVLVLEELGGTAKVLAGPNL
jgi:hypothetical protein